MLREVLACDEHHARAAATRQLRYWHSHLADAIELLRKSANDPNGLVRLEAAIAASYIGSKQALDAMLDIAKYPRDQHLAYAFTCALGSRTLRHHWEGDAAYAHVPRILKSARQANELVEPKRNAAETEFDSQQNLKLVNISCMPERMMYTVKQFAVTSGQPVKLVFTNLDATDHNLVFVKPDALEEVGMAANEMAKDPANANSDFIPLSKQHLILHYSPMIGPTRQSKVHVLRFNAPDEPGVYPYVCTFPGHWVVMTGEMIVVNDLRDIDSLLASRSRPTFVKEWVLADLSADASNLEGRSVMRGMKSFMTARCNQCHAVGGHGSTIGPDLTKVAEKYKGARLLQQILDPSSELNEKYRAYQVYKTDGAVVTGTVLKEDETSIHVIPNLLTPDTINVVPKEQIEEKVASKISSMPEDMINGLTKDEILDLLAFLEAGGYQLPAELRKANH